MKVPALITIFVLSVFLSYTSIYSQNYPESRVRTAIEDYVLEQLNLTREDVIIEFPRIPVQERELAPNTTCQVLPTRRKLQRGNQVVRLGLFSQGRLTSTVVMSVKVRTFQFVVVSRGRIPRNQIITREHLRLARLETTNVRRPYFTSVAAVVGKRSKRMIQAGEIITADLVEEPPLVTRGQRVSIHFNKGALELVLPGIARRDGRKGEEIRVRCLDTDKTFKAQVVDATTVIVNL